MGQLNNTCGSTEKASVVQTSKLLKSFEEGNRKNILMKDGIFVDITPKEMVAMKVDMGIPWEKVKYIARLKNFLHYLFLSSNSGTIFFCYLTVIQPTIGHC